MAGRGTGPDFVESLARGLDILAWAIHPDAFPEPPKGRVARVSGP